MIFTSSNSLLVDGVLFSPFFFDSKKDIVLLNQHPEMPLMKFQLLMVETYQTWPDWGLDPGSSKERLFPRCPQGDGQRVRAGAGWSFQHLSTMILTHSFWPVEISNTRCCWTDNHVGVWACKRLSVHEGFPDGQRFAQKVSQWQGWPCL